MAETFDRLRAALGDRYRIERELASGGVVSTESRGSADVAESDVVNDGVALQDVTISDVSREAAFSGWKERGDDRSP
jgi:hypothetical protein